MSQPSKRREEKFRVGRYLYPVEIERDHKYYYFYKTPMVLKEELKALEGSHWCGYDPVPKSCWRADISKRNNFQLLWLRGGNPYKHYQKETPPLDFSLLPEKIKTSLLEHQVEGLPFVFAKKRVVVAWEMGLGKSLLALSVMHLAYKPDQHLKTRVWFWVCPKRAASAVRLEIKKWPINPSVKIVVCTYDDVVRWAKDDFNLSGIPYGLILDEAQKIKNPTTLRSKSVARLVELIWAAYPDPYIIPMSGTPAPKEPTDWWNILEMTCPGYVREGSPTKLKQRLAWVTYDENEGGQSFPKMKGWKNDESKCSVCFRRHEGFESHKFVPSIDEVSKFYRRIRGIADIKLKKDCLNLPPKSYETIKLETPRKVLEYAKLIKASATRAVEALTNLRELSDGFLYSNTPTGEYETCLECVGSGKPNLVVSPGADVCPACMGKGRKEIISRKAEYLECPKDQLLLELLEDYSEYGRFICYSGFQASVDKCTELVSKAGWKFIKIDGRGCQHSLFPGWTFEQCIEHFQTDADEKICFVGNPESAGEGLTLHRSPVTFYFSNSFNGNARMQSEDRGHRIGMRDDGGKIIDCVNLDIDYLVIKNLRLKKDLQAVTMGELRDFSYDGE